MATTQSAYYVPHGTKWPILGSIGLTLLVGGFASFLNDHPAGEAFMIAGFLVVLVMLFGWFGTVIRESESGTYNSQVDLSFRWGMGWFIFSEVMFFAAFFGALFYTRMFSVPWLGGEGAGGFGNAAAQLWPNFQSVWPTNGPGNIGGEFETMEAIGIPAINTIILLSSGGTVTMAHWAILKDQRRAFVFWLMATVVLGFSFVGLQAFEYHHAFTELNLTLHSGAYGTTFYMLTGFHGLHVSIGAIMLTVMMIRGMRGHFSSKNHFAFEAAAWYWHFVDVVWLGLFIFVYWL